jgi:hypothetical protein
LYMSPLVTFDSWTGASSASASGGSYRSDVKAKATSTLTFTGTGVTWVTATSPSAGKATVTIDGVVVATVDLYSPTVVWQVGESPSCIESGAQRVNVGQSRESERRTPL